VVADSPDSPSVPPGRPRWKLIIAGVGVVVALVLVALFTIPITHRFSDGFNATPQFGGASLVAPQGSSLSINWSVIGGSAMIQISNGYGQILFSSPAASGSFAFTSTTPSDEVAANSTASAYVYLDWSYSAPVL